MNKLETVMDKKWLTKRDRQIIIDLYYSKVMNSDQIENIYFKYDENGNENKYSRIITLRRLKKLVNHDILKKFWFSYNNKSSMQHFYLGPVGIEIVTNELNLSKDDLKWVPKGPQSFTFIENTIETINLRVYFQRYIKIHKFVVEQLGRIYYNHNGTKKFIEPDATLYCEINNKDRVFLIERDRGTMNISAIREKLKNYELCYLSQDWSNYFSYFPITLFVTTTNTRLNELLKIFENYLTTDLTFLFTTYEEAKTNIMYKIWRMPKTNNLYQLR